MSEITSYLLRLRQEKVISSEEYWDSELREELTGTVRNALKEEISGEESNKEVKKLVHDIVDEELEIVEEEDEELE